MRSLHAHYTCIATDPNFLGCDIIGIAETRLNNEEILSCNYSFSGFDAHANSTNNTQAPHHGLATYTKPDVSPYDTIHFHSKELEFTVHFMPHSFSPRQVVFLYYAPNNTFDLFQELMTDHLVGKINLNLPTLIIGDFNFDMNKAHPTLLCFMQNIFHCKLLPSRNTTDNSRIDLCFSNITDTDIHLIECPWSDHKAM